MKLRQYFSLVDTQARMALKADSAQYFLGYIWWLLEPLMFVGVFYLVFDIFLGSQSGDFLTFLICGQLTFVWFSKSVTHAADSIVAAAGLIGKINVPKTLFPLSVIQEGVYKQSTIFALLLVIVIARGYPPTVNWVYLVPLIGLQYLMIVTCGFISAILVCYRKDFALVISLVMILLMFCSGVFWNVRELVTEQMSDLVMRYNPMAYVLDAYREILMFGRAPNLLQLTVLALFFAAALWLTVRYMRHQSQALALRAITS